MRNAGIKGVVEPSRLERSVGDADGDGVDVSDWIAIFFIVLMCMCGYVLLGGWFGEGSWGERNFDNDVRRRRRGTEFSILKG